LWNMHCRRNTVRRMEWRVNGRAGSRALWSLDNFESGDEGSGGTDKVVTKDMGSLVTLCPICAAFPNSGRSSAGGRGSDGFHVKNGRTGEIKGSVALTWSGSTGETGIGDEFKRDFHFEAIAPGVNKPSDAPFNVRNICEKIVLGRRNATPGTNSKVAARNKSDSWGT